MTERETRDHVLFTPGPLTTSLSVKQAMLRDRGTRDRDFLALTKRLRSQLLELSGLPSSDYSTVIFQGCGTMSVESVLTCSVPRDRKLMILSNGVYGQRMIEIAMAAGIPHVVIATPEDERPSLSVLRETLRQDPAIHSIAMVHCETTSGILNPVSEVAALAREYGKKLIIDAISSFAGMPTPFLDWGVDFAIVSANKCLESVPGIGIIFARRSELARCAGRSRSVSLDLHAQWRDQEERDEFRYTPPVQVLLALEAAIAAFHAEGGLPARSARYQENHRTLLAGMRELGFAPLVQEEFRSWIITSFRNLPHPKFRYEMFYDALRDRGHIIYSGKVARAECFRVGNIGAITPAEIRALLAAMKEVLHGMGARP